MPERRGSSCRALLLHDQQSATDDEQKTIGDEDGALKSLSWAPMPTIATTAAQPSKAPPAIINTIPMTTRSILMLAHTRM